jgi:3-oxoacyl-[acyl-carrier-protein] synthase III
MMAAHSTAVSRCVKVTGAGIVGVVSCLPERQVSNAHFDAQFGESAVKDVVKMIGVENRFWTDANTSTRDLCSKAGYRLLQQLDWLPTSVDALIFVSQTPDYRLPATACALQADLGLPSACIAFDINLGCSGYPYALWLGMTMVQTGAAHRVLLAVGDTISKIVDPADRSTALLFGDAGTMTAIEAMPERSASFVLGTDGRGVCNLIVPKGGFKDHSQSGDPRLIDKASDCLYMDGGEIFNFTLKAVPTLVNETIELSGIPLENHDGFLFHQANMFMLKHLTKKAKLSPEKTPINIDQYGNTSCASIPLLMTTCLKDRLLDESMQLAMFGFGVGYSWAGASLSVGPLKCAETIKC